MMQRITWVMRPEPPKNPRNMNVELFTQRIRDTSPNDVVPTIYWHKNTYLHSIRYTPLSLYIHFSAISVFLSPFQSIPTSSSPSSLPPPSSSPSPSPLPKRTEQCATHKPIGQDWAEMNTRIWDKTSTKNQRNMNLELFTQRIQAASPYDEVYRSVLLYIRARIHSFHSTVYRQQYIPLSLYLNFSQLSLSPPLSISISLPPISIFLSPHLYLSRNLHLPHHLYLPCHLIFFTICISLQTK
jgi:hypothetical protein